MSESLFTKTVRGRTVVDETALIAALAQALGGTVIPNKEPKQYGEWSGAQIIAIEDFEIAVKTSAYHGHSPSVQLALRHVGIEYKAPNPNGHNSHTWMHLYRTFEKTPEYPLYGGYTSHNFSISRPFQQIVNLGHGLLKLARVNLQEYRKHLDARSEEAAKLSIVAERLRDRGFDVQLSKQLDGGKFSRRKEGEPHFKGKFYEKGKVKFNDLELTTEQFERFVDVLEIKPDPKPKSKPDEVADELSWKAYGPKAWRASIADGNYLIRALDGTDGGFDVSYRDRKTMIYRRIANVPMIEFAKQMAQYDARRTEQ